MKTSPTMLFVIFLAFVAPLSAGSAQSTTTPALRNCELTEQRDLGVWDDAFLCDNQEVIILRRGETLFSFSLAGSANPRELTKASTLTKSKIVACATIGERLWLFLHSAKTSPFAIDARSGKVSAFKIPKLSIPGNHPPVIQSHVIVRHADAALLMIASGDRDTWPRDGNRPIYFWISLKSGRVVRFPIGWDLAYFSRDQRVAVFDKLQEKRFQRRPLQAVDMETGDYLERNPDRKELFVPFSWQETQVVKRLHVRRAVTRRLRLGKRSYPVTGDRDQFAGISLNGFVLPFNLHLKETVFLSIARAEDDFVGFQLWREGATFGEFWLVGLKRPPNPEHVAPAIVDFAMLERGNCVYTTIGHGPKGASPEAFFRVHSDKSTWNVLDGVQRLPELDKQDKDYVEDRMNVRVIDGIGSHDSLALCLFSHFRRDMRSPFGPEKTLKPMTWRRAVILTSDGERYMTDLFREGNVPDLIWLHNSGKVIMGKHLWQMSGSTKERKVQLSETTLRLGRKRD